MCIGVHWIGSGRIASHCTTFTYGNMLYVTHRSIRCDKHCGEREGSWQGDVIREGGGKIRRKTWGKGEPKEKVKRGTYPACADVCCIQEEVVQPDKLVAASLMVCFAAWQCWLAPFLPVAADEITIIAMSHRTSTARQRLFCRIGWVSTSRL